MPPATSTLAFVPELALSDHSSDLASDAEDGQAAYNLGGAADDWLSYSDGVGGGCNGPNPAVAEPSTSGSARAHVRRGKAEGLKVWAKEEWDDTALYGAFLAAKEEYLVRRCYLWAVRPRRLISPCPLPTAAVQRPDPALRAVPSPGRPPRSGQGQRQGELEGPARAA